MSPLYDFRCCNSECEHHTEPFEVRLPIARRNTAAVSCPVCSDATYRQVVPSKAPACVITVPMEGGGHTKDRLLP